jgi:hypothetical protein
MRALLPSFFHSDNHAGEISGTPVPLIGLWNARESSEQFYTDATRPSELASFLRKGNHHVYAASQAEPGSPCRLLDIVLCGVLAENENHYGGDNP